MFGKIFCSILLATVFTDSSAGTGCLSAAMYTYISTGLTNAIFPFVIFFCYCHFATAIIFLLMGCCCLCPVFHSGMMIRIYFSIRKFTNYTNCFLGTGRCSSGMITSISTGTAMTIFPNMILSCRNFCATAVIFFLMCCLCLYPFNTSAVFFRIQITILFLAFGTNCFLCTGCFSTGTIFGFLFCTTLCGTLACMCAVTIGLPLAIGMFCFCFCNDLTTIFTGYSCRTVTIVCSAVFCLCTCCFTSLIFANFPMIGVIF